MFFSLTQPAFGPIASLNRFWFTPVWHSIAGSRGERTDRAGRERAPLSRRLALLPGPPVPAWAHVCALRDDAAGLPYDTPEVQGVRRDALAW